MGMFDEYIPDPPVNCPNCGNILGAGPHDWTGKYGPCALYVWRQGYPAPIDHPVDPEWKRSPEELAQIRLPDEFYIHCHSRCVCGFNLDRQMRCTTVDGAWTTIEFDPLPPLATDAGDNVLLCPVCIDGWEALAVRRYYLCPGCRSIVRAPLSSLES